MPPEIKDKSTDLSSLASYAWQEHEAQKTWAATAKKPAEVKPASPSEDHHLLKMAGVGLLGAAVVIGSIRFKSLPSLVEGATKEEGAVARLAEEATELTANRPQTAIEKLTSNCISMSFRSAKRVLNALNIGSNETVLDDVTKLPSDAVRKHVFNRLLSRLDQGGDYVLHGSYALENQLAGGARKAVHDLDILSTNPEIAKGSRSQITRALINDIQRSVNKDTGDGLTFEISSWNALSDRFFPRMRHLNATAKAGGQEVMQVPLDIRVGAKTLLEPENLSLRSSHNGVDYTATIPSMRKEETLAYKLYTYGNRYFGGLSRKPKDLKDIAAIIKDGADQNKVTDALQAWTSRGFSMAPIRPPQDILGPKVVFSADAQSEIAGNFQVVKGFYQGIGSQVEGTPLRPEVSTNPFAQSMRFLKKHWVVFPGELKSSGN
jgi:hypothetical protein